MLSGELQHTVQNRSKTKQSYRHDKKGEREIQRMRMRNFEKIHKKKRIKKRKEKPVLVHQVMLFTGFTDVVI